MCAIGCQAIADAVVADFPDAPSGLLRTVIGGREAGEALADHAGLPLVSATGSVRMGRAVAQRVAARLGRCLLELGGNNGMIVTPSADLDLTLRSAVFSAAGTCGQRCTTLRRLIVHRDIAEGLTASLRDVYARLPVGDPRQPGVLVGPLIDASAFESMQAALRSAREQGGTVHFGDRVTDGVPAGGYYVRPALVEIPTNAPIVRDETFAPILYVMRYDTWDEAIALHNDVPQGLASAIMTSDVREAERSGVDAVRRVGTEPQLRTFAPLQPRFSVRRR